MRGYRNAFLVLIGFFEEFKFNLIPRLQNEVVDSLATPAAVFKIPMHLNSRYEIEVRYKHSIIDNFL